MRRVFGDELKMLQLNILDAVASFCQKNGISYWIDYGTLLGAIRHKGYIPWDDDIDISMLRKDYDRFVELFNKHNEKYKLICIENTPDYYLPFGKVCDTSTVLYEPDEKGYKLHINIDVFVYDNAPVNDADLKKMYDTRDKLRVIDYKKNWHISSRDSWLKKIAKKILKTGYRVVYPGNIIEKMLKNAKRYSLQDTTKVGNFTDFSRVSCPKTVFDNFVDVEFEGRKYKAPAQYDVLLSSLYGDYMTPPPKEKQVTHHSFVAYVND